MNKLSILVINGPNLNLLGTREPDIYGHETLEDLEARLNQVAQELDVSLEHFQSNHEGAIVDKIQQSRDRVDFILVWQYAMLYLVQIFLFLKYMYLMFINVRNFDTILI